MGAFVDDAKLIVFFAYYIAANFVALSLPLLIYGSYHGSTFCRILSVVAAVDVLTPLRPGPGGHWLGFCRWTEISRGLESFFDAEIVVEGSYDRTRNYCVVYFPHSLFGIGYSLVVKHFYDAYGSTMLFTGADVIFYIPILRRLMTWWGCTSVREPILKKNLTLPYPHNVIQLQPDGIAGMFHGLDHEQIVLNRRKGFCRVALQTGTALVPTYCFGANQVYSRRFGPTSLAARLSSKLKTSLVFWTDRWGIPFGIVPNRTKIVVVLGEAIDVVKTESPTREEVEELHSKFVAAIKKLYDGHKHRMGEEWVRERPRLYLESERPDAVKQD